MKRRHFFPTVLTLVGIVGLPNLMQAGNGDNTSSPASVGFRPSLGASEPGTSAASLGFRPSLGASEPGSSAASLGFRPSLGASEPGSSAASLGFRPSLGANEPGSSAVSMGFRPGAEKDGNSPVTWLRLVNRNDSPAVGVDQSGHRAFRVRR